MTLTSPFCPVAGELPEEVRQACFVDGVSDVQLSLVWDPPWTPEMISEDGKLFLGF